MTDNSSDAVASPMTYAAKLYALSNRFRNLEAYQSRSYMLHELRLALNSLSNEALQEQQKLREEMPT